MVDYPRPRSGVITEKKVVLFAVHWLDLWIIAVSLESSQTTHCSPDMCVHFTFIHGLVGGGPWISVGRAIQPTQERTIAKVLRYRNTCFCKSEPDTTCSKRRRSTVARGNREQRLVIRSRTPSEPLDVWTSKSRQLEQLNRGNTIFECFWRKLQGVTYFVV